MSARVREPTDDAMTEIYDPERPRARMVAPAAPDASASSSAPVASSGRRPAPSTLPAPAGPPPPKLPPAELTPPRLPRAPQARPQPQAPHVDSLEPPPLEVTPLSVRLPASYATPTHIDQGPAQGSDQGPGGEASDPPADQAVPAVRKQRLERSEPIRVISMKDHGEAPKPRSEDPRVPLHVQLRSMAEVAGLHDAPVGLGNLAPPRDPRQARARRLRANVVWAGVAIVLACAIALAIWFVAGR